MGGITSGALRRAGMEKADGGVWSSGCSLGWDVEDSLTAEYVPPFSWRDAFKITAIEKKLTIRHTGENGALCNLHRARAVS